MSLSDGGINSNRKEPCACKLRLNPHDEALRELIVLHDIRAKQVGEYRQHKQDLDADKCERRAENMLFTIRFLQQEQVKTNMQRDRV